MSDFIKRRERIGYAMITASFVVILAITLL